jgi:hypothetical protein
MEALAITPNGVIDPHGLMLLQTELEDMRLLS